MDRYIFFLTICKSATSVQAAMDAGRSNPDPAVQAKWSGFEYAGDEPTLEEFILWMVGQIKESGD